MSHFSEIEQMIGSMDAENLEYFLLGDINVDLLSTATSPNRAKLVEIFDIYGLEQMIKEPTRVTAKSSTLIDLCITSAPTNVVDSGVMHLSISDHSLVYMIRKAHYVRNGVRHIEARTMKFHKGAIWVRYCSLYTSMTFRIALIMQCQECLQTTLVLATRPT